MSVLARMDEFIKQLENGDDEFFEQLNQDFLDFCKQKEKKKVICQKEEN